MKRLLLSLFALILLQPLVAQPVPNTVATQGRPKVAVVLSGGGALGAIHVGALKVLEQAGMPVDMVVGTSMGSIVGALYSVGYDSEDIATMFRTMQWADLFLDHEDYSRLTLAAREDRDTYIYERDFYVRGNIDPQPGGLIRGNRVESVFEHYLQGYTDSINFMRDLPRQFACVATDLVSDSVVVLTSGSLVKSIRSSMSIPGVFAPMHIGDMVLVDGGAKNNFAADVARQLGADIVIGVKFDLGLTAETGYRKLMDIMERSAGSDVSKRARANEKYCDLLIRVPVRGYSSGSFTRSALDSLMVRGERTTREKLDSIMMLKQRACGNVEKDYSQHLRCIADLRPAGGKGLIDTREHGTLQTSLALRFDGDDLAAAQFKGSYYHEGKVATQLDLTLRLGWRSKLRLDFNVEPAPFKSLGASYEIWYKYTNIYTNGKRTNNLSHMYQHANLKLLGLEALNFDCELGIGWDHYHVFNSLWNEKSTVVFPRNEHFFNYHAVLRYSSEDNHYFPTRGVRAGARYAYYTDNMVRWKGHSGFHEVMASCRVTIPLSASTRLRPAICGRLVFGDDLPLMASNMAGGMTMGKFFPQQLPMVGMGDVEFFDSKMVNASLRLQQRVSGRHYLLLDGGVAEHNSELKYLFDRKAIWGAALSYFYNSAFAGPLGCSFGWNSHTHRLNFFLSLGYDF